MALARHTAISDSGLDDRESSPELGNPSHKLRFNKKTGRPIRRNAGQKKNDDGYVDSFIIEEDGDPIELPTEDEDGHIVKPVRTRKRKRLPSPTPPPLDPIQYNEGPNEQTDAESEAHFRRKQSETPIVLQFNVPLGFHGPLMVKLDKSVLSSTKEVAHDMQPRRIKWRRDARSEESQPVEAPKIGFTSLPPEIRNKVYRGLFVAQQELKFQSPDNFCRSAQFLRTCKLAHNEGCSILYGENTFSFDRNRHQRAPFWDPNPKEIGYKDVRQFLNMIGPENLAYLRDIKLTLEDATPSATPYLQTHESRRYINDEHLIDVLRVLRQAKLRTLALSFQGRRSLVKTDVKFLGYLEQIKVDELSSPDYVRWYNPRKISDNVFDTLKEIMTRKKKMYAKVSKELKK